MDLALFGGICFVAGACLGYLFRSHVHNVIVDTIGLIHKIHPGSSTTPPPTPPATG